jgi:hypothetical protein
MPDPEVPAKAGSRRWSAAEKPRILAEHEGLGKADKGALLRREGIYSSLIAARRVIEVQGKLSARWGNSRPTARTAGASQHHD